MTTRSDDAFEVAGLRIGYFASKRPRHLTPTKHSGPPVNTTFPEKTGGLRWKRTHYVYDKMGRRICWCWTTTKNADGMFVGFREVWSEKDGKGFRDLYRARKARWRVKEWALKCFNRSPYSTWNYTLPSTTKERRKAYRARTET